MLEQGICRPSKSPWSSPLHVVAKSSGSIRPVGDYRKLNTVTTPDRYPIPHIQDFYHALYNKSIFLKIDIVRAYFHIPVHPDDIKKTAVCTPFGLFEFPFLNYAEQRRLFRGHLVTKSGIKPLPDKVDPILKYPQPKTIKELRRFLRLLNFFLRFLPRAAHDQTHLNDFLKGSKRNDNRKINWSEQAKSEFQNCKAPFSQRYAARAS
ncbi:gag-pol polyprotein [Trichonephila clavata]|uniref:Gag-pol polyprotein n=1 Tax=Trichonephila clavata TaxID=2740835 RepID=A0A8X6L7J4_TRICU|nr:gag-pol polyprotein [Trichonephila clavata]